MSAMALLLILAGLGAGPTHLEVMALLHGRAAHNAYDEGAAGTPDATFSEALQLGFPNIEIDVVRAREGLQVRHDCDEPPSTRPFADYLAVLERRIRTHGGSVHGDGREFVLTVDVKDCAGADLAWIAEQLDTQLLAHRPLLSRCRIGEPESFTSGAVTICLTGADGAKDAYRKRVWFRDDVLLAFADRVIGGDDDPGDDPADSLPRSAGAFRRFLAVHWKHVEPGFDGGEGGWTAADEARLAGLLRAATERGFQIRFYALNGLAPGYRFAGGEKAVRQRWLAFARLTAGLPRQHFVATDDRRAITALAR